MNPGDERLESALSQAAAETVAAVKVGLCFGKKVRLVLRGAFGIKQLFGGAGSRVSGTDGKTLEMTLSARLNISGQPMPELGMWFRGLRACRSQSVAVGPVTGNNVYIKQQNRRRFLPNLQHHRFWVGLNRFVRLRVSAKACAASTNVILTRSVRLRARGERRKSYVN
jgi:large subunit ribosomal protein L28